MFQLHFQKRNGNESVFQYHALVIWRKITNNKEKPDFLKKLFKTIIENVTKDIWHFEKKKKKWFDITWT